MSSFRLLCPRNPKPESNDQHAELERALESRAKSRPSKRNAATKGNDAAMAEKKKVKRNVVDPDCRFEGEPVPDEEARARWPHHYVVRARFELKSDEDDEDLAARCYYLKAKVDDVCYCIGLELTPGDSHLSPPRSLPTHTRRLTSLAFTLTPDSHTPGG